MELFVKANAEILAHNATPSTYVLSHNKYSDWTDSEFKRLLGHKHTSDPSNYLRLPIESEHRPVDWVSAGAVTPVKDQGSCGSCWTFSATGGLEGANFVKSGKLLSFSEQQLVDCSTEGENAGCGGGMSYDAYTYYQTHSAMTESAYPYTAVDGTC